MRVFVIGGTGAVGLHTLDALANAGHSVRVIARSAEKRAAVLAHRASPVEVSMFDVEALTAAMTAHDAVINIATKIPPLSKFAFKRAWRENDRIRTNGSAAVAAAASAAGVPRLIQESIAFTYPSSPDWLDEDVPVDAYAMVTSALTAERNALSHDGGVVLRFALFYGPGSAQSRQMLTMARWHLGSMPGPKNAYTSSLHLTDAAAAIVAALDVRPGVYNVADDEPLTSKEYSKAIEDAVGKRAWVRSPGGSARMMGSRASALTRSHRVSNAKFKAATGWAPTYSSAREGWKALAGLQAAEPAG